MATQIVYLSEVVHDSYGASLMDCTDMGILERRKIQTRRGRTGEKRGGGREGQDKSVYMYFIITSKVSTYIDSYT